ncbi:MAG: NYN domain-containing protein [Schwartzia sp.]|nr:NYN domain-containing protein [Schwartzia sp. (in: firmicutes)]
MEELKSIALLIDADNTQLSKLESVLEEISVHGRIVVRRAYGNWKKDTLKNWEAELKRLAIKPQQQFDYTAGKNATDMALVIDAMKLLHRGLYDAFAIVSSDSDFTPLAIELRESGIYVIGAGQGTTPEPFRNSCNEFIILENLGEDKEAEDFGKDGKTAEKSGGNAPNGDKADRSSARESEKEKPAAGKAAMKKIHKLLRLAWEQYQDGNYVHIGAAGSYIKRVNPDFDARTYGYRNLPKLIEAFPEKYELIMSKSSQWLYRCRR